MASLTCAGGQLRGECIVVYGDVLFRRYILDGIMTAPGDIVVAVDALWRDRACASPRVRDLAATTRAFSADYLDEEPARLRAITSGPDPSPGVDEAIGGEFIGMVRFTARGAELAHEEIAALEREGLLDSADLPLLLTRLAARHPVVVHYVTGHWLDVDDLADLADARNFP